MSKLDILSKKLAKYGAFTAAIGALTEANGQIVYTDVDPDESLTGGATYEVDFNGDDVTDFELVQYFSSSSSTNRAFLHPANGQNKARAYTTNGSDGWVYPLALDSGQPINAAQTDFYFRNYATLNINSCSYVNSQWCGGTTDKYLGVKFEVSGDTYYGWVRLDILADASEIVVKDFAYNSTPDGPINAGQQDNMGIEDVQAGNALQYYVQNKILYIENAVPVKTIEVYNTLGQKVLTQKDSQTVSLVSEKNGVYLIKLQTERGDIKSFKIHLNN